MHAYAHTQIAILMLNIQSCDDELEASKLETDWRIESDHNFNFEDHIKILCSKTAKIWMHWRE